MSASGDTDESTHSEGDPQLNINNSNSNSNNNNNINIINNNNNNNYIDNKQSYVLPTQIYKNLLANAVLATKNSENMHFHSAQSSLSTIPAFPRNLLFSSAPENATDEKAAFVWSSSPSEGGHHQHHSAPAGTVPAPKTGSSSPVPGGAANQGLVHWMSVMAEHMNNAATVNTHHPDSAVHYMWNGTVEQCAPHGKDVDYSWPRQSMVTKQGYEAKMNSGDPNSIGMQKGVDDSRLDAGSHAGAMAIYNNAPRSNSSASSGSPPISAPTPSSAAMLVVPQPINASKMTQGQIAANGGTARKYQCKMCPQVRGRKRGGVKGRDGLTWTGLDHANPEIFGSKADLQLHTQIHMREAKPYKCSQCAKAFANSSYLSQHTRIHLGIKPYRCEICQRKFTQLSHLQQHIRTHTGDKPYKCRHPGCNKAFSQLSNLQSHSRCHQTDKPYKCNSCYKCFSDEPSLLEHIPKHKESKHLKTHICQYCGKSYTQETYLTKHMQKHAERTDKRPPITGLGLNNRNNQLVVNNQAVNNGHEHPYWPKGGDHSLVENMNHEFQGNIGEHHLSGLHRLDHRMNGNGNGNGNSNDNGEDLVIIRSQQTNLHQNPPAPPPTPISQVIVSSSASSYADSSIISAANLLNTSKTSSTPSSTSAFTPIQSMGSLPSHHHLNHLNHHQLMQTSARPSYLPYDALSFQSAKASGQLNLGSGMEMPKVSTASSFPNQLISLHQIRNYAHQPTSSLMASEHLLGLKEKGQ